MGRSRLRDTTANVGSVGRPKALRQRPNLVGKVDGPVALGSDRAGTHQDHVGEGADGCEHPPVQRAAQRSAAALQRNTAIQRADHVGHHPGMPVEGTPRLVDQSIEQLANIEMGFDFGTVDHRRTLPEREDLGATSPPVNLRRNYIHPHAVWIAAPPRCCAPFTLFPMGSRACRTSVEVQLRSRSAGRLIHRPSRGVWMTGLLIHRPMTQVGSTGPPVGSLWWFMRTLRGRSERWWLASRLPVGGTWDEGSSGAKMALNPWTHRGFRDPPLPPTQRLARRRTRASAATAGTPTRSTT